MKTKKVDVLHFKQFIFEDRNIVNQYGSSLMICFPISLMA